MSGRYVIWDTMGNILALADDLEEAEEIMDDSEYEELTRTNSSNGDVNICVMDC